MVTPAAGEGRMRASDADREHVVDALKAAFVQGRLTDDELGARVGRALAARTHADLAALTADLPAASPAPAPTPTPTPTPAPAPAPAPARARPHMRAVKVGASAVGAVVLVTSGAALVTGHPVAVVAGAVIMILLTVGATAFVAALIALTLKVESRQRYRSRGQLPPGPASTAESPASPRPSSPGPARPRPPGSLAVGHAG
jgi:hypothetical protein